MQSNNILEGSGDSKEFDYLFKIVIVGDSGTGKSCLLLRFTDETYSDVYISTIGVDFKFRTIKMNGKTIKLQIWDTAGQERFRNITSSFYRGAHGVVLVYDVTNRASFENARSWLDDIERHHGYSSEEGTSTRPCIILVGNKNDLKSRVVVTHDMAKQFAEKNDLLLIEASAKDSTHVETAFINLVSDILQRAQLHGMSNGQKSGTVNLQQGVSDNQEGWCC